MFLKKSLMILWGVELLKIKEGISMVFEGFILEVLIFFFVYFGVGGVFV